MLVETAQERPWTPLYHHECSFPPEIFRSVMLNLIRNPNLNSSHLFRGDILLDLEYTKDFQVSEHPSVRISQFAGFNLKTVMIRRLIPRNPIVDKEMDQTCLFHEKHGEGQTQSLVVYLPHVSSNQELPFYHPNVNGVAFLHSFSAEKKSGVVSIHFSFFESVPITPVLQRMGFHLLSTLHKHGQYVLNFLFLISLNTLYRKICMLGSLFIAMAAKFKSLNTQESSDIVKSLQIHQYSSDLSWTVRIVQNV